MQIFENLIYIPCKAKSSRLKNKNILIFNKERLFKITINQAKKLKMNKFILVDSDSRFILNSSKKLGVNIYKRKKINTKKNTSTSKCLLDVLDSYNKKKIFFKNIIILQVTSPLRRHTDILKAYQRFINKKADSVVSVCKTFAPTQWTNTLNNNEELDNFISNKYLGVISQKLKDHYQINGAIYIYKTKAFLKNKKTLNLKKSFAFVMPRASSIDIDNKFDFFLAQQISKVKSYYLYD